MCRLRIPNGILKHWQFAGVADLAERYAGGYAHVTTRANLQIREIEPKNAVAMVEAIQDLGLCSRGSGADNIRNVTGTPTAGIDPQELIDTRPYAREWHFHILNDRSLYGLPRKFNVAFDGGGVIPVLEDTNDIGFQAVEVKDGFGVEPGVWFRLTLGGITGHKDFARDTGVIVKPEDATEVADAIVRVFIEHGDRTNRNKARLKYVLDAWGFEKFLAADGGEARPQARPRHRTKRSSRARPSTASAISASHPQKQAGLNWIGVVLPVGKMTAEQMRGLAAIARDFGDGDIRLTVWQNLLISGVADDARRRGAKPRSKRSASRPRRRRSAPASSPAPATPAASSPPSDTKRHAEEIARWCEARVAARRPGQHPPHRLPPFLRAALHRRHRADRRARCRCPRTATRSRAITSSSAAASARTPRCGREVYRDVKAEDAPRAVERMLKAYLGAPRLAGRELPGLRPPPRGRGAQDAVRDAGGRMNADARRRRSSTLIPETAPFTPEQRAWLNGFFAGLLSLDGGVNALSSEETAALMPGSWRRPATARGPLDDGDDGRALARPAMPIAERMKLAEGRPLRRRLMAAMAQQDCGQCGYNCEDYANAIVLKNEERLNLCVPGGKDTARMLKTLDAEIGAVPAPRQGAGDRAATPAAEPRAVGAGHSRETIRSRRPSSRAPASTSRAREKETWHIEFDLAQSRHRLRRRRFASASFRTTIRRWSTPCIAALGAPPDFPIGGRTLRDVLTDGVSLGAGARHAVPAHLLHHRRRAAAEGEGARRRRRSGRRRQTLDVLAAIEKFPGVRPDPEAFIEALDPLQPRLYSISSSPKAAARQGVAHRRHRALQDRQARAARRRLDLSRRPHRARRPRSRSMSRRRSISACRPIRRCRSS